MKRGIFVVMLLVFVMCFPVWGLEEEVLDFSEYYSTENSVLVRCDVSDLPYDLTDGVFYLVSLLDASNKVLLDTDFFQEFAGPVITFKVIERGSSSDVGMSEKLSMLVHQRYVGLYKSLFGKMIIVGVLDFGSNGGGLPLFSKVIAMDSDYVSGLWNNIGFLENSILIHKYVGSVGTNVVVKNVTGIFKFCLEDGSPIVVKTKGGLFVAELPEFYSGSFLIMDLLPGKYWIREFVGDAGVGEIYEIEFKDEYEVFVINSVDLSGESLVQ
jgi:hypothetical protein